MNGLNVLKLGLLLGALFPAVVGAKGWGPLAQLYVAGRIASNWNGGSLAAYYGAVGVDVFSTATNPWCQDELHFFTHTEYLRFWNAQGSAPISFDYALGLAAQNNVWGTDSTAVTDGLIFGQGVGYIKAKAELLAEDRPLEELGVDLPDAQATEVYQSIISFAVDSQLARSRRYLGAVLANSARRRSSRFPSMLVDAYAATAASVCGTDTAQVAKLIKRQEKAYRRYMMRFGRLVRARGENAFWSAIPNWAAVTTARWKQEGIHSVSAAALRGAAMSSLPLAEELVQYDYLDELEATAQKVQSEAMQQLIIPGTGNSGGGTTDGGGNTDGGDGDG